MNCINFTRLNKNAKLSVLLLLFLVFSFSIQAQETFDQLKTNYTGNVTWDAASSTVTFTSSGTINFTNKATNFNDPYGGQTLQAANWMWNVPTAVQKIVIKKNVTVTGGFHTKGNITITGEDQNTSVIYGTPLQSWADKNNPKGANLDEWHYCQIQVYGGVCYINNLKILDPFSFAVRGWGPQIHMKKVSIIDTRGGWGNHSDGFEGGDNSTIDSCYFETGDDNIKVYFKNLKVTNTEIKMVQNSVPIQFGWGNYNDNASASFENCKITGLAGRGSDMPIIDNAGSTQRNKTVTMNNCYLENTNGTIFRTAVGVSAPSAIDVTITNSYIKVKKYESAGYNANGTRTICRTTDKLTFYDCRTPAQVTSKPKIWIHTDMTGVTGYTNDGSTAEATTDANSDPDDQVAMAMYLMLANQFDTKGIVLASTTRNTALNTLTKFNEIHGAAYIADLPCLNANIGGYPTLAQLNVKESSLTAGNGFLSYSESPTNKYDDFNALPQTVKDLVNELKKSEYTTQNPLYVLIWGPMTEVAMATKHMIRNNMTTELSRMYVVSHWTSSFLNQTGTPCSSFPSDQIQFKPANCSQNCESCAYMHSEAAKTGAKFKFVDLGSIGQSGVVNGSNSFFSGGINGNPFKQFQKSKLGDLFVKSKFAFGKPDGSDCATFLAVLGTYGVKLSDFNSNGVLTESHETAGKNKFLNSASTLMQDLTNISNKAITCGSNPCALDTDKDGTNDCQDLCPNDKNKIAPGNCGCGVLESSGCGVVILPVNSYVNLSQNQVLSNTFLVKTLAYDGNYGTTHGDGLKQINYQIFDANDLSTVLDFFPITSAPYYWSLNTSNYPNGDYQIRSGAVSLDAGETKWVVQNIKINNPITGAEKEETGFAISIYPNPVERYVTIEGDVDSWEVKNSLGKVVLDGNGSTVDLESVENGVLFLQVNQQSFKIIKR